MVEEGPIRCSSGPEKVSACTRSKKSTKISLRLCSVASGCCGMTAHLIGVLKTLLCLFSPKLKSILV